MIKLSTTFDRNTTIRGEVFNDLANIRRRYVMLWRWLLVLTR